LPWTTKAQNIRANGVDTGINANILQPPPFHPERRFNAIARMASHA
jgi:hypothetical protein